MQFLIIWYRFKLFLSSRNRFSRIPLKGLFQTLNIYLYIKLLNFNIKPLHTIKIGYCQPSTVNHYQPENLKNNSHLSSKKDHFHILKAQPRFFLTQEASWPIFPKTGSVFLFVMSDIRYNLS